MKKKDEQAIYFFTFLALIIVLLVVFSPNFPEGVSKSSEEEDYIEIDVLIAPEEAQNLAGEAFTGKMTCSDSDGGKKYYQIGYVRGYRWIERQYKAYRYFDSCITWGTHKGELKEWYCDGNRPTNIYKECPYECKKVWVEKFKTDIGVCKPKPPEVCTCTDSDDGKDYYTLGNVTKECKGPDATSSIVMKNDECAYCTGLAPEPVICGAVVEYYCYNNDIQSETHVCKNRCENSTCVDDKVVETSEYKIVLGGVDRPLVDGTYNGVIREIYIKDFDTSTPINKPCTDARCYSFSILNTKVDSRVGSLFGWVNHEDSAPYTNNLLYSKWIYQDVYEEVLPNNESIFHVRYKSDKIKNSNGSLNYDGEWYIEYWFYDDYFDVEYGFKSNSDALVSTLINIPVPVLKEDLVSSWYIDEDNNGNTYPDTAMIQNSKHFGIGLYQPLGPYLSISNLLLDNLNHGFNKIQLIGEYFGSPFYADGGIVAFFSDDSRSQPRDYLLAEGPSMGKWYKSRYRIKLGVAPSDENAIKQEIQADFEEAESYKYITVPQTPYGLVPVAIFMHEANIFLDKETKPDCSYPNFTYFMELKDSYPRLKVEFYFLISPDYSQFYPGLSCYDHVNQFAINMDCNPTNTSCWVDENKKSDLLDAEKEGWFVFSRHGDRHDGNIHFNSTGADWYLLNEEETQTLYNDIGNMLTNFGAETHNLKDIVPSHWFISSTGLKGLRGLGVKSISGICAFQMAEPSLFEPDVNKIPNYRWHFLDNLDIAYLEQPYGITLGGDYIYFLNNVSTVDRFVDNGVPLFFYDHAYDLTFLPNFESNYRAIIDRIESVNKDKTSWFFPYEFGLFLYGLKKIDYTLVSASSTNAIIIVDNTDSNSEDVKGLTFRLGGYPDTISIDSITTSLNTTTNIIDKHSFWVDVPKNSMLQIDVSFVEGGEKDKGVLTICVKEDGECAESVPIGVYIGENLIYNNTTTNSYLDISLDVGTYNITIGNKQFLDVYINSGRTELHAAYEDI